MKGRLITDNMHNFCNLINAANIVKSPSVAVAAAVPFAYRSQIVNVTLTRLQPAFLTNGRHTKPWPDSKLT